MILRLARHGNTPISEVEAMPADEFAAYYEELLAQLREERDATASGGRRG